MECINFHIDTKATVFLMTKITVALNADFELRVSYTLEIM